MSSVDERYKDELLSVLLDRVGFSPQEQSPVTTQYRVLARVPKDKMKSWLVIMRNMKAKELSSPWTLDVSKLYFLDGHGKLVYGWRLILKAKDFDAAFQVITSIVKKAPGARVVLDSYPLPGNPQEGRNTKGVSGKGATESKWG